MTLAPREERKRSQQQVIAEVRRELAAIPGARAFAAPFSIVGGGQRGEPLQFVLAGENIDEVGRLTRELQQKLAEAEAHKVSTLMQALEKTDPRVVQALAAAGMQPGQLIAQAFGGIA